MKNEYSDFLEELLGGVFSGSNYKKYTKQQVIQIIEDAANNKQWTLVALQIRAKNLINSLKKLKNVDDILMKLSEGLYY